MGSLPVGSATYSAPRGAIYVSSRSGSDSAPGDVSRPMATVASALRKSARGGTIVLRGGSYHEKISISPSQIVTIQAYPGEAVWFDGSSPVTNWTRSGAVWVSSGWTSRFDKSASFSKGSDAGGFVGSNPMAASPDQVFLDGEQLWQVGDRTQPGAGQFAVDYDKQTITVGSDPTRAQVSASSLDQAFVVSGRLTLKGVGIRRYATSLPQMGTVYVGGAIGGSTFENVVVRDNATQGMSLRGRGVTVSHVTIEDNGMTGLHSNGSVDLTVEHSVLANNNTQLFNTAPATAGIKITRSSGTVITQNSVTDNQNANGIWLDVSDIDFTITRNKVSGNPGYGILAELSDTGIVAGNWVSGAKYGFTAFNTGNVQVFNNRFDDNSTWDVGLTQDARRNAELTSVLCPWLVRNITVSNNIFANASAGANPGFQFYALDKATRIPVDAMNVLVSANIFAGETSDTSPRMVAWGGNSLKIDKVFSNPGDLVRAKGAGWLNGIFGPSAAESVPQVTGRPLPAAVAAALGVPAGTRWIGPIS